MLTIGIYGFSNTKKGFKSHDNAIALIRDGEILANLELERFSRIKQDCNLAKHFDILIKPWLKKDEKLRFVLATSFTGDTFQSESGSICMKAPNNFKPKEVIKSCEFKLSRFLKKYESTGWVVSHELAHIGSCLPFYGSFKENSLLMHIDGGASVSANSVWTFKNGILSLLYYDWDSLKREVNYFNDNEVTREILGLSEKDHLSMPGKLMGLASHGSKNQEILIELHKLDNQKKIEGNKLNSIIKTGKSIAEPTKYKGFKDIAATMQYDFENSILNYIKKWKDSTDCDHFYYSGGAALNIHTNSRIENELNFKSISIPPVPSDCGLALGAAAIAEWNNGISIKKTGPFIVKSSPGKNHKPREISAQRIREIAELIANGKIIGACIGDAETGPRALGHRSIIARPDKIDIRKKISETMKQREWYRPLSPMILEDTAQTCLDKYDKKSLLGKFMLGSWSIYPEFIPFFSGVIHVDNTVRAQIVKKEDKEQIYIYSLLKKLKKDHGIYGLINTSFNRRGEPIVNSHEEALKTAQKMGIDAVWIENDNMSDLIFIKKEEQNEERN